MRRIIERAWLPILTIGLAFPIAAEGGIKHKSAPQLVPVLVAPVQGTTTYQAPAQVVTQTATVVGYTGNVVTVGNAPTTVGNAPAAVAGTRIKAVDRSDLIEEAQIEANKDKSGTKAVRRKRLTEFVSPKYAEAVGGEEDSLNENERNDIAAIVNSIIDGQTAGTSYGQVNQGYGYYAPASVLAPVAPTYSAPPVVYGAPVFVQPMIPVQVWIPDQPKHHFFKKH